MNNEKNNIHATITNNTYQPSKVANTNVFTPSQVAQDPLRGSYTPSQAQTRSSNSFSPFTRIPLSLINLSITTNRAILPAYLYISTHSVPLLDFRLDTNLSSIVETFCPSADPRKSYYSLFRQALNFLITDTPTFLAPVALDSDYPSIPTSKTSLFRLYYLDRDQSHSSHFTTLTHSAYYSIVDLLPKFQNPLDALNLYIYLLYNISYHAYFHRPYRTTLSSISSLFNLGPKTISHYLSQFASLNLITWTKGHKNNGTLSRNSASEFTLPA